MYIYRLFSALLISKWGFRLKHRSPLSLYDIQVKAVLEASEGKFVYLEGAIRECAMLLTCVVAENDLMMGCTAVGYFKISCGDFLVRSAWKKTCAIFGLRRVSSLETLPKGYVSFGWVSSIFSFKLSLRHTKQKN